MRVEKDVSRNRPRYNDTLHESGVSTKTSGAGEGACKQGAGLVDEEACADEVEDEND